MKYNLYDKNNNNLLVKFEFYDKRVRDTFLKQFKKLKRQVDIVEVK